MPSFKIVELLVPNSNAKANLTCRKIGQVQPRVIIYINVGMLEALILRAKLQDL